MMAQSTGLYHKTRAKTTRETTGLYVGRRGVKNARTVLDWLRFNPTVKRLIEEIQQQEGRERPCLDD